MCAAMILNIVILWCSLNIVISWTRTSKNNYQINIEENIKQWINRRDLLNEMFIDWFLFYLLSTICTSIESEIKIWASLSVVIPTGRNGASLLIQYSSVCVPKSSLLCPSPTLFWRQNQQHRFLRSYFL